MQETAAAIVLSRRNALAHVRLDRPAALNALNDDMRAQLAAFLPGLSREADIYALAIRSGAARAFCAGGDVRELLSLVTGDGTGAAARRSLAGEYALNWRLECFSKPTVSLIDGLVAGSGVGLTGFGTHRVAGAGYAFAMPETAIGLVPDVGAAHTLARLPHHMGLYLGLTGRTIGRADAYALGLATHCIEASHFDTIEAALAEAEPVDPLLDGLHADPGASPLSPCTGLIADAFAAPTVAAIIVRLETAARERNDRGAFAQGVLADLASRSPTALKATLRHIRTAAHLDVRQTLVNDYRVMSRLLVQPDFREGVRAMLIDKDRAPRWKPATLSDVGEDVIAALFEPARFDEAPVGDLALETREEMQALRA